jgi:hypothetical protein
VLPGDKFVLGSAIGNISFQASQILGFVAGAAVVAVLGPSRTLGLDALTFLVSALIVSTWVQRRPAPTPEGGSHLSLWQIAREGAALVFRNPMLRSLVLFGWLAGFYVLPEGLAAPYARALGGGTLDVGLLMAAMPVGTVIGGFAFGRLMTPSTRLRVMGWLAMLSCAPLIFSLAHPPLAVLVLLWALAGAGGAYQLAAAAAFVTALPAARRVRAFAVAESGLLAAQGLGILTGGAVAQRVGAPGAVALAGLMGLLASAALATDWTRRHTELISMLSSGRVTAALAGTGTAAPLTPPAPVPAAPVPAPPPPDPAPRPAEPPVLNLPVSERGTGLSAPPPPPPPPLPASPPPLAAIGSAAGPDQPALTAESDQVRDPGGRPGADRAPGRNARRSAHRASRDLSLRARLAATRLLDQVLGDRRVLPFLWDDDPRRQVHQHEDPRRHQGQGDEDQPDHRGVDAGVLTDPGADAGQEPTFPCPD